MTQPLKSKVSLLKGIEIAKREIEKQYQPDGFNIGINVGAAAGQTVSHLHVHLIPRYKGDVEDPRGGVRYVIPEKGNYLSVRDTPATYQVNMAPPALGVLTGMDVPMLGELCEDLIHAERVDLVIAFILESGLTRIEPYLLDVLDGGGRIRILTGDYMDVTEPRALLRLLDLLCSYRTPRRSRSACRQYRLSCISDRCFAGISSQGLFDWTSWW